MLSIKDIAVTAKNVAKNHELYEICICFLI